VSKADLGMIIVKSLFLLPAPRCAAVIYDITWTKGVFQGAKRFGLKYHSFTLLFRYSLRKTRPLFQVLLSEPDDLDTQITRKAMIVAIAEDEQAHTPNKVAIAEQGQEVKRSNASHAPSVNSGELLISKSVVMPDVLGKESWEPLVKVRGKTIPVTMPHMLYVFCQAIISSLYTQFLGLTQDVLCRLFVSLLLASAASRLEIYPRAQIYTDLIHYAHMPSWWDQQDCDQMINTGTGDLGAGAHTSCRTGDSLMGMLCSVIFLMAHDGSCKGAYAITAIAPWFTAAWWAAVSKLRQFHDIVRLSHSTPQISDKVGRKPILVLSTVGVMITKIPILVVLVLGDDRIRHVGAGRAILGLGSVFHSVLGGA